MESTKKPTEKDVLDTVTVRLIHEHEKPRWDEIIGQEHYLHNPRLVGPPAAKPVALHCIQQPVFVAHNAGPVSESGIAYPAAEPEAAVHPPLALQGS